MTGYIVIGVFAVVMTVIFALSIWCMARSIRDTEEGR